MSFYVLVYCYERSYSDLLPIFLSGCSLVFLLVYGNFKNMTDTNLLSSGRTEKCLLCFVAVIYSVMFII